MSDKINVFTYKAPINDLVHSLEVAGAGQLNKPEYGFTGKDINTEQLLDWFLSPAEVAEKDWAPSNYKGHNLGAEFVKANGDGYNHVRVPKELVEPLRKYTDELQLSAPIASEKNGGMEMPWAISISLSEMFNSANLALALGPLLTQGAVEALEAHGSNEVQEMFVPNMVSGKWSGTMLLTEPHAGSDLSKITTKAVKKEDGTYDITGGDKFYITWGEQDIQENIVHLVLAKTNPDAEGTRGISLFAVPKYKIEENGMLVEQNGVECVGLHEKAGIHASPTAMMKFGEKAPATAYLIGEENKGMKYMLTMMNRARLSVGRQGVAVAERAIQAATIYATERPQGKNLVTGEDNVLIIQHPDVQKMILTSKAKIAAGRMICDYTAVNLDKAQSGDKAAERELELFTSMAKAGCTDMAVEVTNTARKVAAGFGYMKDSGFSQYIADAGILPIYEGTNGIQALNLVGRQLHIKGEKPGQRMYDWISKARSEIKALKRSSKKHEIFNDALNTLDALKKATDQLVKTDYLKVASDIYASGNIANGQKKYKNDKTVETGAVATDYLHLFDRAAGAFMMSRSVHVADSKNNPTISKKYRDQASVYAQHVLPEHLTFAQRIKKGASSIQNADIGIIVDELNLSM